MTDAELRQLEREAEHDPVASLRLRAERRRLRIHDPGFMSADEQRMAFALGACTFSVGSFDKRFARSLHAAALEHPPRITPKQAALLPRKVVRYRRQIDSAVVALAQRYARRCATCREPLDVRGCLRTCPGHPEWRDPRGQTELFGHLNAVGPAEGASA